MEFGFIGQELYATTMQGSAPPITTITTTTTSIMMSQQQPHAAAAAAADPDSQTGPPPRATTYFAIDGIVVSEAEAAHNTLLVGLLIALVAASVTLGGLAIYCLRRRALRRMQSGYQAELRAAQQKQDEEQAARGP
ncbi:hypothetical protein IF1G_02556 [Cordyceps javanica]|uniref:Uncharacterized protein n=1 Tax=Cordyceps javanica TaxID=43265 RepID=A0A545W6T5_9HYPO|nr:hypothetical protein IF1G_02556 [Cordyceps javanica]TQW09694.1 incA protein domain-containing protein [Cordyceps javanica]